MAQVKKGVWLMSGTGREMRFERLLAARMAFAAWMWSDVTGFRYCSGQVHWVVSWTEAKTRLDRGRWR